MANFIAPPPGTKVTLGTPLQIVLSRLKSFSPDKAVYSLKEVTKLVLDYMVTKKESLTSMSP
jgi:hypothetical protein